MFLYSCSAASCSDCHTVDDDPGDARPDETCIEHDEMFPMPVVGARAKLVAESDCSAYVKEEMGTVVSAPIAIPSAPEGDRDLGETDTSSKQIGIDEVSAVPPAFQADNAATTPNPKGVLASLRPEGEQEPQQQRRRQQTQQRGVESSPSLSKAREGTKSKGRAKPKPKAKVSPAASEAACPSSKPKSEADMELKELRQRMRPQGKPAAGKHASKDPEQVWHFDPFDGERDAKKFLFISFYKEQYSRLKNEGKKVKLNTSQYDASVDNGLTITDGHRPMARPEHVQLPPDFREPLGAICKQRLAEHGCSNTRILICIHGDIFDVSDRPDKYGADGPYWEMAGKDITWALVCGGDVAENYDKYYDLWKFPSDVLDRKLQGLCSWWAFFANEYGEPVGRLNVYDREWLLPVPPHLDADECSIM